ncbi:Uncharacterized protein TPAR_08357 [Tolypocladium paradoxum]|uniref:Uncharacterized protein n=1 Tax=Tolypocladium paradoxum TaxID=94208 RepID=A0A2S4KMK0_9HYPO|nr:Uncharacterized protein TPAR_08357 [Tolypocladium paradoxum]
MAAPSEELPPQRRPLGPAVAFYCNYAENSENKTLEGRWGTVPIHDEMPTPDGPCFYSSDEEPYVNKPMDELYGSQPCWFHLRRNWPSKPGQTAEIELDPDEALGVYATVSPMPDFPSTWDWSVQLGDVHTFLVEACSHSWMSMFAGTAMLKILTRGIQNVVAISDTPLRVMVDKNFEPIPMSEEEYATQKHFFPAGYRVLEGHFGLIGTPDNIHEKFYQRRLYAGLIDYQTGPTCERIHWGSFVWDRQSGYLIVFDAWEHKQPERLRAFLLLWRQMLYRINYPYTFSFLLIPATAQRRSWESGYLALTALHHLLRGMVGLPLEVINTMHGQVRIVADTTFSMQTPRTLQEFLLRDWCFHGPGLDGARESYDNLLETALLSLRSMAANELGIRTSQFFIPCGTTRRLLWDFHGAEELFGCRNLPRLSNNAVSALRGLCPVKGLDLGNHCEQYRVFRQQEGGGIATCPWEIRLYKNPSRDIPGWKPPVPQAIQETRKRRLTDCRDCDMELGGEQAARPLDLSSSVSEIKTATSRASSQGLTAKLSSRAASVASMGKSSASSPEGFRKPASLHQSIETEASLSPTPLEQSAHASPLSFGSLFPRLLHSGLQRSPSLPSTRGIMSNNASARKQETESAGPTTRMVLRSATRHSQTTVHQPPPSPSPLPVESPPRLQLDRSRPGLEYHDRPSRFRRIDGDIMVPIHTENNDSSHSTSRLGSMGRATTIGVMDKIGPLFEFLPEEVAFLPTSQTYASLVHPGLMALRCWDGVHEDTESLPASPALGQSCLTRAERAQRRNMNRDECPIPLEALAAPRIKREIKRSGVEAPTKRRRGQP